MAITSALVHPSALFCSLQATTAHQVGVSDTLLVAAMVGVITCVQAYWLTWMIP